MLLSKAKGQREPHSRGVLEDSLIRPLNLLPHPPLCYDVYSDSFLLIDTFHPNLEWWGGWIGRKLSGINPWDVETWLNHENIALHIDRIYAQVIFKIPYNLFCL